MRRIKGVGNCFRRTVTGAPKQRSVDRTPRSLKQATARCEAFFGQSDSTAISPGGNHFFRRHASFFLARKHSRFNKRKRKNATKARRTNFSPGCRLGISFRFAERGSRSMVAGARKRVGANHPAALFQRHECLRPGQAIFSWSWLVSDAAYPKQPLCERTHASPFSRCRTNQHIMDRIQVSGDSCWRIR